MPEGPEIRRSADTLAAVLQNQKIHSVTVGLESLTCYQSRLTGHYITEVTCRGKAMLLHFDNGLSVYAHNQLYGRWIITPVHQLPDTNRSLRLGLHTASHSALLYSASDISVWPREKLSEHPFLQKLGPDVLNDAISEEVIRERLMSARFCNRSVAALYLDQQFIAGIGNYLRSEILFFAGVHPDCKPKALQMPILEKLATQTLKVTKKSYATGGYTAPVSEETAQFHSAEEFEAQRFMVFGRDGLPCRQCGEVIQRVERSSRRLYFCPCCQAGG